ncbi:MAG: adenylate kinase, partial [Ramlibacter sp.]
DHEDTVTKRLDVYAAQTRPLVDYYSSWAKGDPGNAPKYRAISGTGTVEEITARALQALSN